LQKIKDILGFSVAPDEYKWVWRLCVYVCGMCVHAWGLQIHRSFKHTVLIISCVCIYMYMYIHANCWWVAHVHVSISGMCTHAFYPCVCMHQARTQQTLIISFSRNRKAASPYVHVCLCMCTYPNMHAFSYQKALLIPVWSGPSL
jgi:hypothetical protein